MRCQEPGLFYRLPFNLQSALFQSVLLRNEFLPVETGKVPLSFLLEVLTSRGFSGMKPLLRSLLVCSSNWVHWHDGGGSSY